MRRRHAWALALVISTIAACGSDRGSSAVNGTGPPRSTNSSPNTATPNTATLNSAAPDEQQFPDVVDATAVMNGDTWTFEVTISSPYDTPERYADAWRVQTPDGSELAVRVLEHDHAGEQPFTRSLSGVTIPAGIDTVTIQGRDLVNGYGGTTFEVDVATS